VPKLWNQTIETHRREVRDAVLDAADALVSRGGPLSITMSGLASEAGIGRATLYKYFPDVESVIGAWHERRIGMHLEQVRTAGEQPGSPAERLKAVLKAYAHIAFGQRAHRHSDGLAEVLHQGHRAAQPEHHLRELLSGLVAEGVREGEFRDDVPAAELAAYCLHSATAARTLSSEAAVDRLVDVTLAGLKR
jgi:AcrR family transcriptional regulator